MVKTRVKNSIMQRNLRGEESVSLIHSEIPSHLWSQISKTNPQTAAFASFLRGEIPDVKYYPSLTPEEYLKLRNVAIEKGWLDADLIKFESSGVKTRGKKTENAADRIRRQNSERLFEEKLKNFLQSSNVPVSAVEFRVVYLMREAAQLLRNPEANQEKLYDLALSLLKLPIEEILNVNLKADFLLFQKQFLQKLNFNIMHALEFYPQLLANPSYMDILPRKSSYSLRPNQKKMVETLLRKTPVLLLNRDSLGAGKTVAATKLAIELYQQNIDKMVIFCCASLAIRINVAQMAAATQVPFALYQNNGFLYPPYIAQDLKPGEKASVKLLITDYENVKHFLETESGNFVLILDEPTIGADRPGDRRIHMMIDVLFNYAPEQTALVSGTLPSYEDFKEFYDSIRTRQDYPNSPVVEIKGSGSSLGCDLIRPNDTYYVPENLAAVKNTSAAADLLQMVLDNLRENPLLTRFHNFRRLFSLIHFLETNEDVEEYDDYDELFLNPANWKQEVASRVVRLYLESFLETPSIIPTACAPEVIPDDQKIDFNRILTREANRMLGGCLVVSSDPLQTAYNYAGPLVKQYAKRKMYENKITEDELETDLENYGWELLGKEVLKPPVVTQDYLVLQERVQARDGDEGRGNSRTFRHGKMFEGEVDVSVSWGFPEELQINSPAHQRLYSATRSYNDKKRVTPVIYDDLPQSSAINTDLLVFLAMGIGIYDEQLPSSYLDAVINLATQGKISFLFSNLDISYGVTIPLNRLIIEDDEIVETGSTATMIQLLGRIGRLGRMALVYTRGNALENKFNNVLEGHQDMTEKENILLAMEKF